MSIAEGKNPVGTTAANTNPITIGGVDGDNKIVGLVLNADGSITAKLAAGTAITGKFIPVDADGDEKFTPANPASVQLTGRRVSVIYPAFAVGTTAVPKAINGKLCTINVLSGSAWINPLATAETATAFKLTGAIDMIVDTNLSLISDATGASVQIIVWA